MEFNCICASSQSELIWYRNPRLMLSTHLLFGWISNGHQYGIPPWWSLLGTGITYLVKSPWLQFISRSGTRRWNLRVPDLQMTCSVSTRSYGSRILVQVVTTRRYSLFQYLVSPKGWQWHILISCTCIVIVELTIFERDMWCGFSGYRRTEVNPALGHMYIMAMISLVSWNKERYKIMMCFIAADNKETTRLLTSRAHSRLAPRQWETSLQCNAVSHWLGANLELALDLPISLTHITLYIYIYILRLKINVEW